MADGDISDLYRRFMHVFDTEPTHHALYQQMIADFDAGRRTKASILSDLDEAEAHRLREAQTTNTSRSVDNVSL